MDKREIAEMTGEMVQRYYNNDIKPFLDHLDDKVLWYGPAKGQFLSGKQAIIDTWAAEKHSLTFTLGNIRLDHISSAKCYCEVMVSFQVTTHYPDGSFITMDQIIHVSWCERKIKDGDVTKIVPRMLVIHISDLYRKHEDDNIYPVHLNEIYKDHIPVTDTGKRIHFCGMDSSDLYLLSDTIIWVESSSYGRHSILHTTDGDFHRITTPTSALEKKHPDFLLRCHMSYLINPRHVKEIRRFQVTLSDGKELPIPEKKYTAFKKTVYDRLTEANA